MHKEYIQSFAELLLRTVITGSAGKELDSMVAWNEVITRFKKVKSGNGMVYLVGNGGSNAIASHASIDLINVCKMKAFAFSDGSQLTCMANDFGYPSVFQTPLETMFQPADALIAISSSGTSENIINAARVGIDKKGLVVTYSGFSADNTLRQLGHYNFWLDSDNYGKVEIGHALLVHLLCDRLA